MYKIDILGMGPGSMKYINNEVIERIKQSDILISGKRLINGLEKLTENKEIKYIESDLEELSKFIKKNRDKKIAVLLSGDTGFYSLLTYLKKSFNVSELNVIPGISSMQYMFAKISETWFDAYISSVHGRESDYLDKIKIYEKIGLLSDKVNNPVKIAKDLLGKGYGDYEIFVGENLSYKNEKISSYIVRDLAKMDIKFDINFIIIKKTGV